MKLKLTFALQVLELSEKRRDVNDDSGSDEGLALGVHETCTIAIRAEVTCEESQLK